MLPGEINSEILADYSSEAHQSEDPLAHIAYLAVRMADPTILARSRDIEHQACGAQEGCVVRIESGPGFPGPDIQSICIDSLG